MSAKGPQIRPTKRHTAGSIGEWTKSHCANLSDQRTAENNLELPGHWKQMIPARENTQPLSRSALDHAEITCNENIDLSN